MPHKAMVMEQGTYKIIIMNRWGKTSMKKDCKNVKKLIILKLQVSHKSIIPVSVLLQFLEQEQKGFLW